MIGSEGINTLVKLLNLITKKFAVLKFCQNDDVLEKYTKQNNCHLCYHHESLIRLSLSLIDATWSCIIGSCENEDHFLNLNGPTYLINLLEVHKYNLFLIYNEFNTFFMLSKLTNYNNIFLLF